jgi:Na+-driven multidrug efflux pump
MTFLFDSAYSWVVAVPYAYALTHFTKLDIFVLYPICYITDAVKGVIGVLVVRTGYWAQNIVSSGSASDGSAEKAAQSDTSTDQ